MGAGKWIGIAIGLLVVIQLVPYGRDHTNPTGGVEPTWDSAETRALFFRACRDCHSNETQWPWYSHLAPVSWLVQADVEEGRSHFNVSDWGRAEQHGDEAAEEFREEEMPLWFYLPLHPDAQFSADERDRFIAGLVRTFGEEAEDEAESNGDDHSDGYEHEH